jgi:hypothetical protein
MRIPLLPRLPRTPAIVIGTAALTASLVGATSAFAAVHYVVLGGVNKTTKATYINNSAGTPLALTSKAGYAPLAVGSSRLVKNLNADYVDGLHASAFARSTGRTGIIEVADAAAKCPAGTVATGGGGAAFQVDPANPNNPPTSLAISYSGPDVDANDRFVPNSWIVVPPTVDANTHIVSFVECYNPKGAVPGAATATVVSAEAAAKALSEAKVQLAR